LNIAFLVPYTPTRIRTRSLYFLKTLAQNGHRVRLYTLWSNQAERDALQDLAALDIQITAEPLSTQRALWNMMRGLPTSIPLQAWYSWQPTLARRWMREVEQLAFDIVHVEHLRGARYARAVRTTAAHALVWDSVDCISALFEQTRAHSARFLNRFISRMEYRRTRAYEAALVREFPQTVVVSEAERNALLTLAALNGEPKTAQVHVVPIGTDTVYFSRRTSAREPATILFSGKMSYHANLTAALYLVDEIMPRVWAQQPEVRVLIVGANPPNILQTRADSSQGKIVVTGTVPDIRPFLERATIAVAPMVYAAGAQFKVIEAMAMETPVITTAHVAAPLNAQRGRDLLTAESAADFSDTILALLSAPAQQMALAANGRAFVETNLSWESAVAKLLDVYALARARVRN